ncbi:MAG TPA: hypothetical protein VF707_05270, partial [Ardenticatenaceae bacterium]
MTRSPRLVAGILLLMLAALIPTSVFAQSGSYNGRVVQTFTNCGVTQVIGTVLDANGTPRTGVGIRLWWGDGEVSTVSGTYVRPETD